MSLILAKISVLALIARSLINQIECIAVKQESEKVLKSDSCEFQELSTLQAQARLGRFCPCLLAKVS